MYRVLLAQVLHETNTFSVRPADLEVFRQRELIEGQEVIEAVRDTNTELAGFIASGLASGWDLVPVIATEATPCGLVSSAAWHYFRDRLLTAVQQAPVDAVLLALHGAMVSEAAEDADGALAAAVRAAAGPDTMIGCTLDLHANVSDRLAQFANILLPYRSYPHVDMRDRGEELAQLASRAMADPNSWRSYVFRNRQLDGCDHGRSSGTLMPELLAMAARASEAQPMRVGICAGFPWADVSHAGPSVVISGPVDHETAARAAEPLLKKIWETRAETSLAAGDPESICSTARQLAASGQRVLIADYSDNPGGGGYGTTTALLAALLRSPGPPAVFAPLCDAPAAAECAHGGVGSGITITLGAMPETAFSGPPLVLSGKVVYCADTRFRAVGPMWTHRELRLGMTAVLACGTVDVVITSYPLQVTEPAYLEAAGVDLERKRIIAIKSLQHFRAAFASWVDAILFVDSGGLVSNEYRRFPYVRVRRPIWPLDEDVERQ